MQSVLDLVIADYNYKCVRIASSFSTTLGHTLWNTSLKTIFLMNVGSSLSSLCTSYPNID